MTLPSEPAPKPDSETGLPRPPRAPVAIGWKPSKPATDIRASDPPPGKGPALEWSAQPRGDAWKMVGIALILIVAGISLYWVIFVGWEGFGWMKYWPTWLLVLAGSLFFLLMRKGTKMTAGSDWVYIADKRWIDTYNLREITVTRGRDTDLKLVDNEDRQNISSLSEYQRNRNLWDLVYNGILHSAAYNNARVNSDAISALYLKDILPYDYKPFDEAG